MSNKMKILISGAGIAGNALAFWLSKLGHQVTVLERTSELRTSGLQLDLRGHGIEVMKLMGLEEGFRSKMVDEKGLAFVDSSDKRWAFFPTNRSGNGIQNFSSDFEIMRGDLCRLIYEATKSRTKYKFGMSIKSISMTQQCVEAVLSDGTTEQFDLIVGADGQNSRTRRMMTEPDMPEGFVPLGSNVAAYFTTPRPLQKEEEYIATMYVPPGKRTIMTRRHSPDLLQVYLLYSGDGDYLRDIRPGNVDGEKKAFREMFQDAGWQTKELLSGMDKSEDFYCQRMGLVKLPSWSRGRVALVGDAGYCSSPMTGMGTTSAMVGAYVLAGEIGKHCQPPKLQGPEDCRKNLAAALAEYDKKFRPFMDQVQRGIVEGDGVMPASAVGIYIYYLILWICSLLRVQLIAKYFLRETIQAWDLPEYEELEGEFDSK